MHTGKMQSSAVESTNIRVLPGKEAERERKAITLRCGQGYHYNGGSWTLGMREIGT